MQVFVMTCKQRVAITDGFAGKWLLVAESQRWSVVEVDAVKKQAIQDSVLAHALNKSVDGCGGEGVLP